MSTLAERFPPGTHVKIASLIDEYKSCTGEVLGIHHEGEAETAVECKIHSLNGSNVACTFYESELEPIGYYVTIYRYDDIIDSEYGNYRIATGHSCHLHDPKFDLHAFSSYSLDHTIIVALEHKRRLEREEKEDDRPNG